MSQSKPTQHEIDVYAGEYVLTGDKTKSWRKAFPNSKAKPEAAHVAAQKMHNFAKVLVRIDELRVETAEKDAEEFDLSVTELKTILKEVIDLGLGKKDPDNGLEKALNLSAVNASIQELNRMNGNHATVKTLNTNVDLSELSSEELDARIKMLSKGS